MVAALGQGAQGDGVGRGAHRGADATDVGGHEDGQGQARAGAALGQGAEDGDDDGEHGGGGRRVGHEHAQQRGDDHQAQHRAPG